MELPVFLMKRPEPARTPEFTDALKRYEGHFGNWVSTEELVMSKEDIIEMIDECIATGVTWQDYLGHPGYEDDTDY